MKKVSISIPTDEGNISSHILFLNEQSKKLAVVFPGQNNSCEIPTMYYPRQLALQENYDVLCLSLIALKKNGVPFNENITIIVSEINKALIECTKQKEYSELLYISRSLGNMISGYHREKYDIAVNKQIFIVPIKPSHKYVEKYGGLVIAGTCDHHYSVDEIRNLKKNKNIEVFLVKDGNHSLETDEDISKDLENMDKVIKVMREYLIK